MRARIPGQPHLPPLPPDALIIVPVRNIVLFPGLVLPITVGRPRSIAAAQQAVREQRQVGILMQRAADVADPPPIDMHRMGTVANIVRYVTAPDGTHHLVCQGDQRFQVTEFLNGWPFFVARVLRIPEPESASARDRGALSSPASSRRWRPLQLLPQAPPELLAAIQGVDVARQRSPIWSRPTWMSRRRRSRRSWRPIDLAARMDKVSRMLAHRIEVLRLSHEIGQQTKAALDKRQREVLLREQMAAIQRQLGEGDEGKAAEMAELDEAIAKANMPQEVEAAGAQGAAPAASACRKRRPSTAWCAPISTGSSSCRGRCPRRSADRHRRGAPHPRRGSFRAGEDQAAHHRVSRRAQARAAGQGADPVLRRPARRRQDLARPVDRPRHEPQIRPRQPRRRA